MQHLGFSPLIHTRLFDGIHQRVGLIITNNTRWNEASPYRQHAFTRSGNSDTLIHYISRIGYLRWCAPGASQVTRLGNHHVGTVGFVQRYIDVVDTQFIQRTTRQRGELYATKTFQRSEIGVLEA